MTDQSLQITQLQPHLNQADPQWDKYPGNPIKAAAEEIAQCCSQTEETFAKLELV